MAIPIEVTENIKECIEIIDKFVNSEHTPNDETVINAMKYLKITTNNALKGGLEPLGCPDPKRMEKIK